MSRRDASLLRRGLACASVVLLALTMVRPCHAIENWYLEIKEPGIDASIARRSVGLELHELVVPGDPRHPGDAPSDVSLYFRVDRQDGRLCVLLWDRGQYIGKRAISDNGEAKIIARRVGLAAAELAHDLTARRHRDVVQINKEHAEAERVAALQAARDRKEAFGLETGVQVLGVTQGAWRIGPQVGAQFNSYFPVRFSLRIGWAAGAIPALSGATSEQEAPAWSAWEVGMGSSWIGYIAPDLSLSLGVQLSAEAVHVGGPASVDHIAGQRDTWSARVGLESELAQHVSGRFGVGLRLVGGTMLRRIPLRYDNEELDLGGLYVGGALRFSISPG